MERNDLRRSAPQAPRRPEAAEDEPGAQTRENTTMNDEKLQTFKSLTFGTELEYENITRQKMAEAIQGVVGGTIRHGGPHNAVTVTDPEGREWKAMDDGSLRNGAEFVTPILRWENIELLQAVVRAIRHAGAKTPATTSQHVHVGVADFTAEQLTNLVRIHYKQEKLIHKAFGTLETRLAHYTRPTDRDFVERILARRPRTLDELNEAWFGRRQAFFAHYDGHRYRSLNLNPVWEPKHTVEWRFGNGTTHSGEAKTMVALCLAMAAKAKLARAASARNPREYSEASAKYDMRVFLLHLGLSGDEFKSVRMHLLKRLPGSAAWKNGRPTA